MSDQICEDTNFGIRFWSFSALDVHSKITNSHDSFSMVFLRDENMNRDELMMAKKHLAVKNGKSSADMQCLVVGAYVGPKHSLGFLCWAQTWAWIFVFEEIGLLIKVTH